MRMWIWKMGRGPRGKMMISLEGRIRIKLRM